MNSHFCKYLVVLSGVLMSIMVHAEDAQTVQQERQKFGIACAGAYDYQAELGGFDANLLAYKRALMGQLVYNDIKSTHYADKEYFEQEVGKAFSDLKSMSEADRGKYHYEQWKQKPIFCDELSATVFILVTTQEWLQGVGREYDEAQTVLWDIYPWENETLEMLREDLDSRYKHVLTTREQAGSGSE